MTLQLKSDDPFFGLKFIAFHRSRMPKEDVTHESMIQFAKWQICKSRGILYNDPVWEEYTDPEILIEYFTIRFDEDENLAKEFEAKLVQPKTEDYEWFERMEAEELARRAQAEKVEEFEDVFE